MPAASVELPAAVMDASVALAWLLHEPGEPAQALRAVALQFEFRAPALWRIETLNGLLRALRRSRVPGPRAREALALLAALPVRLITEPASLENLYRLASDHQLSAYDACYLDLAQRYRLPLATLDAGLRQAALRAGLQVL